MAAAAGGGAQRKKRRYLRAALLAILVVVAICAVVPSIRWRFHLLFLGATGQIPDIELHDLVLLMSPSSGQSVTRIIDTRNPYAVIRNPRTSTGDINAGGRLFQDQCATCHSPDGSGTANAPALFGREFKNGDSDWAVYRTIRYGVANTAMAAHPLAQPQIWQLVAYVRSLDSGHGVSAQAATPAANVQPLSYNELQAAQAPADDWLTYSGSYSSIRHSLLTQITPDNVQHLAVRWIHQLSAPMNAETTPLVRHGVMFATFPPARVMAFDAATGKTLWTYTHPLPIPFGGESGGSNRGVAMLDDKVFVGTGDARLIALSARTGTVLWDAEVGDYKNGVFITGAPLAVGDMVVIGVGTGRTGRGFISAFDANTGKERWRFYSIPQAGEAGNDTWAGDSWRNGGGPTWLTGSYDPQSDLIYWGIGNPKPDYDSGARKGDDLYTDSVVALHGSTGKLAWYFQFTPADDHDWDSAQIPLLVDQQVGTATQKLLLWANRNGFYYVLDRETGKFLAGVPFAKETWADGLDSHGRPIPHMESSPTHKGVLIYPGNTGGTNWWPPTYDPALHRIFLPVIEQGMVYFPTEQSGNFSAANSWPSGRDRSLYTAVRALDASTGKLIWEYKRDPRFVDNAISGLLSTQTGLLFGGDESTFFSLSAETGDLLWSFPTGGNIAAPPVTYSVNGEQFVAVASGSDLLAFALPKAAVPQGKTVKQ